MKTKSTDIEKIEYVPVPIWAIQIIRKWVDVNGWTGITHSPRIANALEAIIIKAPSEQVINVASVRKTRRGRKVGA